MSYYEVRTELREVLDRKHSREEVDTVLFTWVKTGHITMKEFKAINRWMAYLYPYDSDDPEY